MKTTVLLVCALILVACGATDQPPSKAFDLSLPEAERIQIVKHFVEGQWYQVRFSDSGGLPESHENYTFLPNGSWNKASCRPYGEMAERKYKPEESGKWSVTVERYLDSGKIFYAINMGNLGFPQRIVDRDSGFVTLIGKQVKPLKPGHRKDCP